MGVTGRDGSCDLAKSAYSSSKNKKSYSSHKKDEHCQPRLTGSRNASFRIREMGPICKTRKQAAVVFPESREEDEDADFSKQFGKEGWPDDDECMWLSSGTSLDEEKVLREDLKEEEVATWLVSTIGSNLTESPATCSESASSSCGQSCESSSTCDNSSSPFSIDVDSPSQTWDLDRTTFWLSLVNLDGEDSKWISDTESEFDYLQYDFPRPSYRSGWSSETQSSSFDITSQISEVTHENSRSILSTNYVPESMNLEDFGTDEPLFWPSDQKSDWTSEVKWDFLIMSPLKNNYMVGTTDGTSPESISLKLHANKMDSEERCKRRIFLNSGSTSSKILELKRTSGNKHVRRFKTMTSRLSKESKISMKIVPLDLEDDITEAADKKHFNKESVGNYSNFLDDNFASCKELPIEKLLGLDEFDGHEGVELDFNNDVFSLDESV